MTFIETFDLPQRLPGGFAFPTRMTALGLGDGSLALVSPIPITEPIRASLRAHGEVRYLVAPNLLHHLYLAGAKQSYPEAKVLAPRALRAKRPDLVVDLDLEGPLPSRLTDAVDVVAVRGAPSVDEFVFFHRATGTLVTTDLVFNLQRPEGLVAHVVLWLVGCHGKLATSRSWSLLFVRDREAMRASCAQLCDLPVRTLVMAHGDVVREGAREGLRVALARFVGDTPSLPATT